MPAGGRRRGAAGGGCAAAAAAGAAVLLAAAAPARGADLPPMWYLRKEEHQASALGYNYMYKGPGFETTVPKKCFEPLGNLRRVVSALEEDPPNFSLARQVYMGKGGGAEGKSLQEYILRDDAALGTEYGRAIAARSSPAEVDAYILGLFDEDSDLGVPPGTSPGVLRAARAGALDAAIVHGVTLKLNSEYYHGMVTAGAVELNMTEEERLDGRNQDVNDASDEALLHADLLICLFAGGGEHRLIEEGIIEKGAKDISATPGLGYFNEMRYSHHCKLFGTCENDDHQDWEGYLTLSATHPLGNQGISNLRSGVMGRMKKFATQISVAGVHQELLHAAGETELALMPAALASKPEAWIAPALAGQALMHVAGPLLANAQEGRFQGTAATLADFFRLEGAAPKSPEMGAYCLAHRDLLAAFGTDFRFIGELISANNIICTGAGEMVPASPYYFDHMQGPHVVVRYYFVNARQISMSGKVMRQYFWEIWRGGVAPGTDMAIASACQQAWREYSLTIEKFASMGPETFPHSAYYQAASARFPSEAGEDGVLRSWLDVFIKGALSGNAVSDARARVAAVQVGVQDLIPATLVLGLVETSAVTPCSELDEDDDLFKGAGCMYSGAGCMYSGPGDGGVAFRPAGGEDGGGGGGGGGSGGGDDGSDDGKRRRSLLECPTAAQSTLLSKIWDEAAFVYSGGGWQGHHQVVPGYDFTPYARAEEYGRLFGTMEGPASKANAFIMDAFRARTSADNAATIRKHILVTYAQMTIERAHRLDAELAVAEPDEEAWALTQAEGWTAWRVLEPLVAQSNATAADEVAAMLQPSARAPASNASPPASLAPSRYCYLKAQLPGMLGLSAADIGELRSASCLCGGGPAVGECAPAPAPAAPAAPAPAAAEEDSGPSAAGPAAGGILGGGAVLVGALAAALLARERRGRARAAAGGAAAPERV